MTNLKSWRKNWCTSVSSTGSWLPSRPTRTRPYLTYFSPGSPSQKLLENYDSLNLDSIPEHKVEKFSLLFEKSDVELPKLTTDERERPLRLVVVLPPDCRCCGCQRALGGEAAQYQNQFPSPAMANLVPGQTFQVKHPELNSFSLVSCGDRPDCIAAATTAQLKLDWKLDLFWAGWILFSLCLWRAWTQKLSFEKINNINIMINVGKA